ncbi:MAG: carboxylating nicotinate-nucleotide diphosphorylase [Planctomycetes bacterium]|nr:carboxylating nicotinate-nucleotide diphosphorylase [Planctomycetota bacterium]MBU1518589.1 carboxylating nicotinate-nucleotide diphosphorylase [Planctomycetota bacterium]MBU2457728.1 carboxylating nicotinate-nucleotide diphosphorylase [Planctomycetota bacterium]MBU2596579.1 carboxylating nicotinate-nucleotide diphosphorylase [Planctomycetota bacterium]
MKSPSSERVSQLIDMAIEEDYGGRDPSSELMIPAGAKGRAYIITREEIVVSGMNIAKEVLKRYNLGLKLRILKCDGQRANVADRLGVIEGPIRSMLSAERVVLNFLQRLCGIATMTYKYVHAVRGTKAKIYDTRKTIPGWRELEKYAVRCGKGRNHRFSLREAVMFKDNHITQLGKNFEPRLKKLVEKARKMEGVKFVCVEVDHVDDQLNHVLKVPGIDVVLLDNMGQWQYTHAVEMRDKMCRGKHKPQLEASGGITLNNVRQIALCGVDRISIGAITHSAVSVDIGMDREF